MSSSNEIFKYCSNFSSININPSCRNFLLDVNSSGKYDVTMNEYCSNYNYINDNICGCINSKHFCPQNNEPSCKNGLAYKTKSNIEPCSVCVQNLDQSGTMASLIAAKQVCNSGNPSAPPPSADTMFPIEYAVAAFLLLIIVIIVMIVIYLLKRKSEPEYPEYPNYPAPQNN